MKLHLPSFDCTMNGETVRVAMLEITDLNEFLRENHILQRCFNPDFVNLGLNRFIFCTDSIQWNDFVNDIYEGAEKKVVLELVPAPDDFNIDNYFFSNPAIINYILHPEMRDYCFLMEAFENQCNKIRLSNSEQ